MPSMPLSETRTGELLALSNVVIGALGPVVFIYSFRTLPPLYSMACGTLLAACFFALIVTVRRRWSDLFNRHAWRPLLFSTLLIAVACHTLMFLGYAHTTAGNASIIALVEILFSFVFFGVILRRERYTRHALFGAGLMLVGVLVLLVRERFAFHLGDLIIIAGLLFAPPGNYFQQQTRRLVSAEILLFSRSVVGGCVMLAIAFLIDPFPTFATLSIAWPMMLFNGLVTLGVLKIVWIESIHRIPVAKALMLSTLTPAFTLVFAFLMLGEVPNWWQVAGFLPMLVGSYLITNKDFLHAVPD